MKQIKAGELFMISGNEGYDYKLYDPLYQALKSINLKQFTSEFLESNNLFGPFFGEWLVRNGHAEKINCAEINFLSTSTIELCKKENTHDS